MKSKNTIELNGKRYDAVTGAVIGAGSAPQVTGGKNIDGFFRTRTSTTKTVPTAEKITVLTAPAPKSPKKPSRSVNHARAHTPQVAKTVPARPIPVAAKHPITPHHTRAVAPNHTKAHAAQHSQTLIRTAVKRPTPSLRKQLHPAGALQHTTPSLLAVKPSVNSIDESRLARAKSTSRSPHVSRHARNMHHIITPKFAALSVQPVPVKPEGNEPAMPPAPQPTNKPTDIFEHALANASNFVDLQAHKQHHKRRQGKRAMSLAAATLAVVVIAGFAAYQTTPGLQIKVAGLKAGVATASLPNFKAAGFAYDGVKAGDGKLTIGFSDASGNYELTQQQTNFTSTDLVDATGASDVSTADFKTLQVGDMVVYRFNNVGATWVNDGEWYTITGSGSLSDSQVTDLARNI